MNAETVKEILMWCTILNGGLFVFSSLFCMAAGDLVYRIHSKLFRIPRDTFNTVLYSFLGIYKIIVIAFNLVPWLALEIIL